MDPYGPHSLLLVLIFITVIESQPPQVLGFVAESGNVKEAIVSVAAESVALQHI